MALLILDPALFKMRDEGEIKRGFSLYLRGRLTGLFASIILMMICIEMLT